MAKPLKKISKKILKSKFVTGLAGWLIYLYAKLAKLTVKWHIEGLEQTKNLLSEKKAIFLVWHGRALMTSTFWPKKVKVKALVSLHQDGRLIAGFLHHLGVKTIGGSTNNNAKGSALNLLKTLQTESSIVIIPDGPRGPCQRLSKSPIYYAQKTGAPIIHATYSIKNSKTIKKSWDQMMLPKLFSKGILLVSDPVLIPQDLSDDQIEEYRLKLESQMNEMQNRADEYTGTPQIQPENEAKQKRK